jgi:hypothetical protein
VSRLFSVDSGYKELSNLTRILSSIIVMANTADEALACPTPLPWALAQGAEHRIAEVNHVVINRPDGEAAVIEEKRSRQFHC